MRVHVCTVQPAAIFVWKTGARPDRYAPRVGRHRLVRHPVDRIDVQPRRHHVDTGTGVVDRGVEGRGESGLCGPPPKHRTLHPVYNRIEEIMSRKVRKGKRHKNRMGECRVQPHHHPPPKEKRKRCLFDHTGQHDDNSEATSRQQKG